MTGMMNRGIFVDELFVWRFHHDMSKVKYLNLQIFGNLLILIVFWIVEVIILLIIVDTWQCEGSQGLLYSSQPLSPDIKLHMFSNHKEKKKKSNSCAKCTYV